MMDALARALNEHRRALHKQMIQAPAPGVDASEGFKLMPRFKPDEIERMLRIEIDRDNDGVWLEWQWRNGMHINRDQASRDGPRQFQRVDVYIVDTLPAPGWRIVNPMVKP